MSDETKRRCCFTGHRGLGADYKEQDLYITIKKLVERFNVDTFICGGACGFDMEAGYQVLKIKEDHPSVKLWLFLPCLDQDAKWSDEDKKRRKALIKQADLVDCPNKNYDSAVMKTRNYKMVDNSHFCVSYFNGKRVSGTAQTLRYAKRLGRAIINISAQGNKILQEL